MTTSSSPLMCQSALFLMKLTFKLYTKCKIWGVLFAWEMGYYAMVQDICAPYCSCCAISAKLDSQTPYHRVQTMSFLPRLTLKLHTQCQIQGYPLSTGNGMMCCDERHPLLLEGCITFIRCISRCG